MWRARPKATLAVLGSQALLGAALLAFGTTASAVNYPITPEWRATAEQVAQAGVPLSELAPNAPDSYVVKRGDTLWAISGMFLLRPWRWPELWGMNYDQIRNPHLIYPGQILYLERLGDRARLRVGQPVGNGTIKLSPRVRSEALDDGAITSIPVHLIEPFLNEAVIFNTNELEPAPRIVATQEGRVLLSRGETAYVRGELGDLRDWRLFRNPKPLKDPATNEVLGYEATYLGTAEYVRPGGTGPKGEIVPASFRIVSNRLEVGVGDRLAPVPPREFINYVPHAPQNPIEGQIASIYGEGLTAGQNQIVALNKGAQDGIERGHVLALWRKGREAVDTTYGGREKILLPDERHGLLFVFRVFDRMSYALILNVQEPVQIGDRFTQP
ncbi:LysM peptidoglycan-binding domain-containing protein [Caldimonas thermodepolymerans]|nr:LysM domain-containing protein [Caldimonas thermodepolymerans]PPE68592.1 peptidoglycan-binding protein [Caldimonas thermodepolymerans]UZG44798.1 LysM peptidoglycan-binding domain-containing protein [Caldimonas thermodepolymerans]UZG48532.1 LysM peptidoglycan-binding domain-containing protein [Caldimonas thermodepolymerans]